MKSIKGFQYSTPNNTTGKFLIFPVWIKCRDLKQFVESAESARCRYKTVRVLHQHYFAHEEIVELHKFVEVRIGLLLLRQYDVAAD